MACKNLITVMSLIFLIIQFLKGADAAPEDDEVMQTTTQQSGKSTGLLAWTFSQLRDFYEGLKYYLSPAVRGTSTSVNMMGSGLKEWGQNIVYSALERVRKANAKLDETLARIQSNKSFNKKNANKESDEDEPVE